MRSRIVATVWSEPAEAQVGEPSGLLQFPDHIEIPRAVWRSGSVVNMGADVVASGEPSSPLAWEETTVACPKPKRHPGLSGMIAGWVWYEHRLEAAVRGEIRSVRHRRSPRSWVGDDRQPVHVVGVGAMPVRQPEDSTYQLLHQRPESAVRSATIR